MDLKKNYELWLEKATEDEHLYGSKGNPGLQ